MEPSAIVTLANSGEASVHTVGGKAANLARLAVAGLPVPPGFVVTAGAWSHHPLDLATAIDRALGSRELAGVAAFAVRSSAVAEDLQDASFAGQYETLLDVPRRHVVEAVARCRDAATSERVSAYSSARTRGAADARIAVLVQPMIEASAAGVAFTANPFTGDRDEMLVNAVRGLGERLVSGEAVGDEWSIRGRDVVPRRLKEQAISPEQALAIARLARRVEELLETPQDIEWAIESDGRSGWRLLLLQARPMTALPPEVSWVPPGPGLWSRNFRLGEWLPEPMTPLFEDWLLPLIEDGFLYGMRDSVGAAIPFRYAVVNGWYFNAMPRPEPHLLVEALTRTRGRIIRTLFNALIQVSRAPVAADRHLLAGLHRHWRDIELPDYERLIAAANDRRPDATSGELIDLVDRLGRAAGRQLWFLSVVGGSAWKMEACLTAFVRKHVPRLLGPGAELAEGVQVLLRALPGIEDLPPALPIQGADWVRPIEDAPAPSEDPAWAQRRNVVVEQRRRAESACRSALAGRPATLRRFTELLDVVTRYALIREHQARAFPAAWPVMRSCAMELGEALHAAGALSSSDQVFFLHRAELERRDTLSEIAEARRARWERQLMVPAPLTIGEPPRLIGDPIARAVERARGPRPIPPNSIVGEPASTGIATGPARIITDPSEFPSFRAGDVLVARTTAPVWTPLFARAAAIVTDGGALAAHASIVAREYGIPAVVGTGDATRRIESGQRVTVDGTAGIVTIAD